MSTVRSAIIGRGASPTRIRELLPPEYELVQAYPVRLIRGTDGPGIHTLDDVIDLLSDDGIEATEVYSWDD